MNYKTSEEAIQAAIEESGGFLEEFSGKNCHDIENNTCEGWDIENRRCECGNRRVAWETHQYKDGTWMAYAEAY